MVVGIAFKLGVVPFHMWVPDVYDGAPLAATLFISTVPKLAAFAMAYRLLAGGLPDLHGDWQQMLAMLAVLSLVLGNLAAIMQIYHEAVHGLTAEHYDVEQRRAWAPERLRTDEEHWRNRLGGLELLLGIREEAPAGFCAFTLNGHVDLLFTHPAHARCGIARRLLEEAERRMRRAGTIQAHTGASRLSRPLFEKLGYLVVSEDVTDVRGAQLPHTNMRKFL